MIVEGMFCSARGHHFGYAERHYFRDCAAKCIHHGECRYFNYDPNDGECFMADTSDESCGSAL